MKNSKTILLTAVSTAILFGAIIISSCSKSNNNNTTPTNLCANVTCQNGGTCASGVCTCPTGYTGALCQTPATTTITYTNNTYTPMSITANGNTQTIAVGGNVAYTGSYGTTISITASTSGKTTTGTIVGTVRNWAVTDTFPASGTFNQDLNTGTGVFFLKIKNNDPTYSGNGLYVNYGLSSQTYDAISIPNNGVVYNTGYYVANTTCEIYVPYSTTAWVLYPTFSYTLNQSITMDLP